MKQITIDEAKEFATLKHAGQIRDFSKEPYINHPMRVADTLYRQGFSTDVVIAALCHDVLEDTDTTIEELTEVIGSHAATLVWWVSEPYKLGESSFKATYTLQERPTKQFRKAEFRKKLAAAPAKAQSIKVADILDNTNDMAEWGHMNTCRSERFANTKRGTLMLLSQADKELIHLAYKAVDTLDKKLVEWLP